MIDELIIQKYVSKDAPKHRFYDDSVEIYEALEPHADGEYPTHLIDTARPNEPAIYKEYRKNVFEPITKTYYDKVLNVLSKIQMADDWDVKWPETKKTYSQGESPKEYIQEKYPDFQSIENWFFSVAMDEMLEDPNSIGVVYPIETLVSDNDYIKPVIHLYESEEVIEFKNGKLCVIKLDEIPETDKDLIDSFGFSLPTKIQLLIFCDQNTIEKWIKTLDGNNEVYKNYYIYEHKTGVLPCIKLGGRIKEYKDGDKLYESFIQSCVPHWNEACRRYSDHQVNMALHLHPDRWEIADAECKVCKGSGVLAHGKDSTPRGCTNCNGIGKISVKTPFGTKMIRPTTKEGPSEAMAMPTPPMGYAERPVETIDYLNKEWKSCISQGLSALNMEFLMYEPAINSGVAKMMDRSELNAFIYSVASHIVNNVIQPFIYIILKQRYYLNTTDDEIRAMMPSIKIPVKYDIIVAGVLLEMMKYAKDSGVPGNVMDQMWLEYSAKEFGKDSMSYLTVSNRMLLDPLPHMTVDEKMVVFSNKGCTEEQYIISSQMDNFIIRAFSENKFFDLLPLDAKKKTMSSYAQEVILSTKTMVTPLFPSN